RGIHALLSNLRQASESPHYPLHAPDRSISPSHCLPGPRWTDSATSVAHVCVGAAGSCAHRFLSRRWSGPPHEWLIVGAGRSGRRPLIAKRLGRLTIDERNLPGGTSMLMTSLCRLLGIEHPIFSVGMGTCAAPELAAAVSNAG